jgi:hypothetical protein
MKLHHSTSAMQVMKDKFLEGCKAEMAKAKRVRLINASGRSAAAANSKIEKFQIIVRAINHPDSLTILQPSTHLQHIFVHNSSAAAIYF